MNTSRPNYISADGSVVSGKVTLGSILLTAGADNASITLYDTDATEAGDLSANDIKIVLRAPANESKAFSDQMLFTKGVYAVFSGTSPVATLNVK